jgi:hypothetical protein
MLVILKQTKERCSRCQPSARVKSPAQLMQALAARCRDRAPAIGGRGLCLSAEFEGLVRAAVGQGTLGRLVDFAEVFESGCGADDLFGEGCA